MESLAPSPTSANPDVTPDSLELQQSGVSNSTWSAQSYLVRARANELIGFFLRDPPPPTPHPRETLPRMTHSSLIISCSHPSLFLSLKPSILRNPLGLFPVY